MAGLPRRLLSLATALLALALLISFASACPFCGMQGPTLTGEVAQAKLVLYGQLTNAKEQANGDGTTDLLVETVIKNELAGTKDDPLRHLKTDKKGIPLPNKAEKEAARPNPPCVRLDRYLPPLEGTDNYHYLAYCDFFRGKV